MTSLLQKINELDIRVDGLDSSNLQTQITTNSNDISTLQIDKQDILIAGDNITIVDNVISSTGGSSTVEPVSGKIFCAFRTNPMVIPTVTEWNSEFTTVNMTNNNIYTFTNNNRITVKLSGMYKVECSNIFANNNYLDRANIRTTVTINGVNDRTIGGQSICYPRHKDYARAGTNSGAFIFNLNINDYIQLYNTIAKASNLIFTSDFSGFEFLLGSNILITYLE
jgi:hypothetical protein